MFPTCYSLLHIFALILPLKQASWIRKRQAPRQLVLGGLFKGRGASSGIEFSLAAVAIPIACKWLHFQSFYQPNDFFLLISVALIWPLFSFPSGANYFNHFWNGLCRKTCQLGKQWCFQLLSPHASNTGRYCFYSSTWVELWLEMLALPLALAWPYATFT